MAERETGLKRVTNYMQCASRSADEESLDVQLAQRSS